MPWTPFKHGVTSLSQMNGQEMPGLCLLTMIALEGMIGELPEDSIIEKKFCAIIWMSLSLETILTKEEFTNHELVQLGEKDNNISQVLFHSCWLSIRASVKMWSSNNQVSCTQAHSILYLPIWKHT